MTLKPLTKSLGLMMVADGVSALIAPRKYLSKLETGEALIDVPLRYLEARPELARGLSAVEVVLGAWLIVR